MLHKKCTEIQRKKRANQITELYVFLVKLYFLLYQFKNICKTENIRELKLSHEKIIFIHNTRGVHFLYHCIENELITNYLSNNMEISNKR